MFYLFIILVKLILCIFNNSLQIILLYELILSLRMLIFQMLKKIIIDCSYLINYRVCEFKKNSSKLKKNIEK